MKIEYEAVQGVWVASGEGPMRPILIESTTRHEALQGFTTVYGQQYAEMECHTHNSEVSRGEK